MNYDRFVGVAHVTASCCAVIAAIGATIGFHELSGDWRVAALIGAGTAVVLGLGWYALIGSAASTRHRGNIGLSLVVGGLLTLIALAVSGWALATALGGHTAARIHDQEQIAVHETALAGGYARVTKQEPLLDAVTTARTVYSGYAEDETARGGCGPKCRTYASMGSSMAGVQENLAGQIDEAKTRRKTAEAALAQARQGKDVEANLALVSSTVAFFNSVDLEAGQVGLVKYTSGASGVSNIATDEVTQAVIDADADTPDAVAVPSYEKVSKAEATLQHAGRVAGAWAAAIGIDFGPFLLLLLVIALWREPLLRSAPGRTKISPDQIRERENELTSNVLPMGQKRQTTRAPT